MPAPATFPRPWDELRSDLAQAADWEERYQYIIELGRDIPDLDAAYKSDPHRVRGCMSTVWLVLQQDPEFPQRLIIRADSDSLIVKGLIAILMSLYNRKSAPEIARLDAAGHLAELGLEQHLSAQRRNGLHAMIQRIRQLAVKSASGNGSTNGSAPGP